MNEGRRLASVFVAPAELFEDLRQNHRWLVPFLILLAVAALAAILPRLAISSEVWFKTIQQNIPQGAEISAEQMAMIQERISSPLTLILNGVAGVVLAGGGVILSSLVLWGLFSLFSEGISFKTSLSVLSYTGLIKALGLVFILILSISLQRVDVSASLALLPFLQKGTYLYRLAAQIDLFTVWRLMLLGLGFSVVARASRLKSYLLVVVPWLVLVFILAALRFGLPR